MKPGPRPRRARGVAAGLGAWLALSTAAAQPLFDAHLHYGAEDAARFPPAEIVAILDRSDVARALVSGTPAAHTEALFRHAPARIVPFLCPYRDQADKTAWMQDPGLPARLERALDGGVWRGIGELHIFAGDRHSPVFRRVVAIAAGRGLPLQIHGDPAVIDALFDIDAGATVIWAHAGTYPHPDLIADYLARYPRLYVDLSVRDERVAPEGILADDWRLLLMERPERFLVGVDTFSVERWRSFDAVAARTRAWLAQLPRDVALRIAHDNAAALFGTASAAPSPGR